MVFMYVPIQNVQDVLIILNNMTDQLISIETAKLANEKGFPQENYYLTKEQIEIVGPRIVTQSLLQKWLREEHKIDIIIHVTSTTNEYWAHIPNFIRGDWKSICFKIYEEALEAGLIEGLHRI